MVFSGPFYGYFKSIKWDSHTLNSRVVVLFCFPCTVNCIAKPRVLSVSSVPDSGLRPPHIVSLFNRFSSLWTPPRLSAYPRSLIMSQTPPVVKPTKTPSKSKLRKTKIIESDVAESSEKVIDLLLRRFQEIDGLLMEKMKDSSSSLESQVHLSLFPCFIGN